MLTTTDQSDRHGFSLLEMLVAIGVICFLLMLLMSAINHPREDARRSQCANYLRIIGLALHNYHDVFKTFPASGVYGNGQVETLPQPAYHHTWLYQILPFIEASPLYDSVNQDLPAWGQPIVGKHFPHYRCPSDTGYQGIASAHGIATTNYSAAEGYHWWATAMIEDQSPWSEMPALKTGEGSFDAAGIFAPEHYTSFDEIADGTFTTVMVAENTSRGHKNGPLHTSGTGVRRVYDEESVFRSAFVFTAWHGQIAGDGGKYSMVDDSGAHNNDWFRRQPYSYAPTYIAAFGINTEWPGADSGHLKMANCLLADGSVSAIQEEIDWPTWLLLNGRSDGRVARIPD